MPLKNKADYNEYMRKYMIARYHRRRRIAFFVLRNKCAKCEVRKRLVIDHIDWRTKVLGSRRLWNLPFPKFLAELRKCQLLCSAHNYEKTFLDLAEIKRDHASRTHKR